MVDIEHSQCINEGKTYMLVVWLCKVRREKELTWLNVVSEAFIVADPLTSHFKSHTPCACPSNVTH